MGRRTSAIGLAVFALCLARPEVAFAFHSGTERIVDGTAHTMRGGEVRIGLWQLEVAPVAFATVGTDTAPWVASFLVDAVVANGHAKLRLFRTGPLTLSLCGAIVHADLRGTGSFVLIPMSLYASSDLAASVSSHLGVTYTRANVDGDVEVASTRFRADARIATVQLHAMLEWRLSRVVALTLGAHAQPFSKGATFHATSPDGEGAKVEVFGAVEPRHRTEAAAIGAIALSGKHVNVRLGAGYGAIFLPSLGLVIPYTTVLPELDVHVRF